MATTIYELINTFQQGNENNLNDILEIFKAQISNYAKKSKTEDISQDLTIFLISLLKKIRLDKMSNTSDLSLIAYISRSIRNEYLRCIKKESLLTNNIAIFLDELDYTSDALPENCLIEEHNFSDIEFYDLLNGLTAKERIYIIQRYKYCFSVREIASHNKVSVQAIYKLENKA